MLRYVVLDDAIQGNAFGWTPDTFAEALRSPLAALGVRVVRQRGAGSDSGKGGLQGGGQLSPSAFKGKAEKVARMVEATMRFRPLRG
jgi:hypothetical protein